MLPDYQGPCEQQEYHITHTWAPTLSSVSVDANPHTLIPHTFFASWHLSSLFFLAPWFLCHETVDFLVVFQPCSTSSPFPPFYFQVGGKKMCRGKKSVQKLLCKVVEWVWRLEQGKERSDVAEEQREDFIQLWAACNKGRVGSGPKGQSPLHYSFEIPILTASNHSCKNHSAWIFLYSPLIPRPSYQSSAAQRKLTLFGSSVPISPLFPLGNSSLGNPFLTTQSLVSPTVKYP